MSRIGKQPIVIPPKVKVDVKGRTVHVEGPKGKLQYELPQRTAAAVESGKLVVHREGEDAQAKALHGLSRAILNNMVRGVTEGFVKKLEIHGVGFKASVAGKTVTLNLGYSHPINYDLPDQVKVTVEENTRLTIEGPDRQKVGQVAADLRAFYPPEPYKGKGIRYVGERIIRKEGKTVQ
ncbi:50S ribosomal protein L6 [Fontisphaera persica]|uniref:50S ribosomal protein L6 n=1 Tax=Fontisphaera persica TaxID=2974023 RepID=UPI0024C0B732|nr:50S ribosomal protein L6 [Fontisphaera persica]WCJ59577.1 50S ribosomal protein L6 [Fontisphaera persica]